MKKSMWLFCLFLLLVGCSGSPDDFETFEGEEENMASRKVFLDPDFDRAAQNVRRQKAMPTVQVVEPATGYWTNSNNIGQRILYSDNANQRSSVLKMDERGAPRVRTVHLGLDYEAVGTEAFRIFAEVNCGAGGGSVNFTMDWKSGASFSAACNSMEVVAVYDKNYGGLPVNPLYLTAIVGEGGSLVGPPTYTPGGGLTLPSGATSALVEIPAFARRVRVFETDGGGTGGSTYHASNYIEMYPYLVGGGGTRTMLSMGGNLELWVDSGIPIPQGSRKMRLSNESGSIIAFNFEFELDI